MDFCGFKVCQRCGSSIEEYEVHGQYATWCNHCRSYGTQICPPDCQYLQEDGSCGLEH